MPSLTNQQQIQLDSYVELLLEFNRRINLISREDEAYVRSVHLPHVLSLTVRPFPRYTTIVDWGTGGGLPAVPLAIALPEVEVYAVDSIEKKVLAVRSMARRLRLGNLQTWHGDAARWPGKASFSVSRATAPLATLWRWHTRVFEEPSEPVPTGGWRPGLICLKGGVLDPEISDLRDQSPAAVNRRLRIDLLPLETLLESERFSDKVIVHVYLADHDA